MENLILLADSMQQAASLLSDDDNDETAKQTTTFLNVVAIGNVGAGKSAVLNSLIGHPVLPTGENGATRVPVLIDMIRDESSNRRGLAIQIDGKVQSVSASDIRHSLQGRFSKWLPSANRRPEEVRLTLRSSTAPPLKLIDLPGLDQRLPSEDSIAHDFADGSDAILLLVVPATSAREIMGSRPLKVIQDLDPDGSRTVGVISKVDQAASDPRNMAAVQALLSGQGPSITVEFPWVALIGQSVSISAAHAGSVGVEDSLETAWRAEAETLKSILSGASSTKLGRISLVETLASQIRKRLKQRLPAILSGLEGRSQMVEEELVRLGEMRVETSEGTRAVALELCREFDDKFLQTINSGEAGGWKVVSSFESGLPNRMKSLPLNEMFDLNSIKKLVLEADGYQPYLLSPEKGLRALVRKALELAKDPGKSCVDEVHRVLVEIVSAAASLTPGLGRYPPFKREIVAIASSALDEYRVEARKMVVALIDMERSFIPPQHFVRLVQRRLDKLRREEDLKTRASRKAQDAEQALLNRATTPQPAQGGTLKDAKKQAEKDAKESKDAKDAPSTLQTAGPNGEIVAGYLSKKSPKNGWSKRWFVLNEKTAKFSYTKKPEEKLFRGVINLEECVVEDASETEVEDEPAQPKDKKSLKDAKKSGNGPESKVPATSLAFKISNKVSYKTVVKAHHSIILKAENMAEKLEWMSRLRSGAQPSKSGSNMKTSSSSPSLTTDASNNKTTSDGPTESTTLRRPVDPEEDLKLMAQEVRDYVEAVLNSLAANIPKAVVLCQVERSKDAMLAQLYSSISAHSTSKIQELLQEDQEVKKRRERCQRQSTLLSKLTRQLSVHEARASTSPGFGDNNATSTAPSTPRVSESEDWRVAFEEAGSDFKSATNTSNTAGTRFSRFSANGEHSGRYSDTEENGDVGGSRRTPTRLPPPPPGSSAPVYRY